eukprot:m51a1_g8621 Zinc finger protein-like 1 (308) ;mRNA; r:83809-85577
MGICTRCKAKTDLYCFVHRRAVCESCCVSDEHFDCHVRTYAEFVTKADFPQPACAFCSGPLTREGSVRLPCLDVVHIECLDKYGASMPPETAQAGFQCPSCSKPFFVPERTGAELLGRLCSALAGRQWAEHYVRGLRSALEAASVIEPAAPQAAQAQAVLSGPAPAAVGVFVPSKPSPAPQDDNGFRMSASLPISERAQDLDGEDSAQYTAINIPPLGAITQGPAPRKPTLLSTLPFDAEDEDKYRRRTLSQLLALLGLMKQQGSRGVDWKRAGLFFGAILGITLLLYLAQHGGAADDAPATADKLD